VVLRLVVKRSIGEASEGIHNQRSACMRKQIEEIHGGLIASDFDGLLQENGAGVETFFKQHGGVARESIAHGYRPLDGRGTPILGEKRTMQVDAA
jgi:hypothetical protein